jgi:hypothetical protein
MGVSRTILTMILALAVAILPAVGGAVSVAKAAEASITAPVQDCCEHHGGSCDQQPGHGMMDDCASMAACAAHCFNFTGLSAAEISYVPVGAVLVMNAAGPVVASHTDPPPFPPPRI